MKENESNTINAIPTVYVCPVCNTSFSDISAFAIHMKNHADVEKKRKEEEEKKRKADQKKVDAARVEKLKKMYEDAAAQYLKAKEKYESDYAESYFADGDLSDILSRLFDSHRKWGDWLL